MIYHISIGIVLDFVEVAVMNEEDIEKIVYSDAYQIHLLVKDMSLYPLVMDKIHHIYTNIIITTISLNQSLDCQYLIENTNVHLKHYILPDKYHLDKQIQATLVHKLNQYHVEFQEIEDFMTYLGIDQKHLRENLSTDDLYYNYSLDDYKWQDIFGKHSRLDLLAYLRECEDHIKNHFIRKQNMIIQRFKNVIDDELRKYFNKYTYIYILNPNNAYSLYQLISQINHIDIQNLMTINKETTQSFKDKYETTKYSKSIFSHKEEKLDDLLQTLDMLIAQRYEIHRFQSMKTIYDQILEYLKTIQFSYPLDDYDYDIPIDFYDDFILQFINTRNFKCYEDFVNDSYIYQQLFTQYDYKLIVSRYEMDNGIICTEMLENECEIYY